MLQAGMLFHSEYSSDVYHTIISWYLRLPFDAAALRLALEQIMARHSIMRTSFDLTSFSDPLQLVHKTVEIPLSIYDLRHLARDEQEKVVIEFANSEKANSFEWNRAPLVRFTIHRLTDDTLQFTFSGPHAIFDGWSDALLFTELTRRYDAGLDGQQETAEPPPATAFRDYVALEQKAL